MSDFVKLKQQVDIVQFISTETGYGTKRVGRLIDLKECPFCHGHNCFRIDVTKNKWTCYQCADANSPHSANGDIFDFIQKHRECNQHEALVYIAQKYNYELTKPNTLNVADQIQEIKDAALSILKTWAVKGYSKDIQIKQKNGQNSDLISIETYLTKVRKHSKEVLTKMGVVVAISGLADELTSRGHKRKHILKAGFCTKFGKDYFADGMILFPHFLCHSQFEFHECTHLENIFDE